MALPQHVDRDLVAGVLAMAGIPQDQIARLVNQPGASPQVILDSIRGRDLPSKTRKALDLAEKYMTSLSGNDLRKLLVEGMDLPESAVTRAISRASSGDTIAQVLERLAADDTQYVNRAAVRQYVAGVLGTTQTLGVQGLNKSKQQYMAPSGTDAQAQAAIAAGNKAISAARTAIGGVARPGGQSLLERAGVGFATNLGQPGQAEIPMEVPRDKAGIMNLQRLLNARGAGLAVDGVYGPKTKAAHQQYGAGKVTTAGPGDGGTLGSTLAGAPGAGDGTVPAQQYVPPLAANASDAEVESYIRRNFGWAAWVLDVPEIRQTLVDFTREMRGQEFSDDQLEARLLGTQWYREKNEKQRARIELKHRDPETYAQGVDDELTQLRNLVQQQGQGFNIDPNRLMEIARTGYEQGWGIADRQAALAAEFDYNPETGEQAASAIVGNLRQMAANYLVPLSEATIDEWGKAMISGQANEDTINGYLREQAKQMLPSFAAQIEAGLTPRSLVEPYAQTIAREMGSDPSTIDFLDPKWNRFVNTTGKDGPRPMSFFEIQQTIRTDDTYGWNNTDVAQRQASEFATQLAQRFGRAG